jgi:hypothetical protein
MTTCAHCGRPVTTPAGQRGARRLFCPGHQAAFNDLMAIRGKHAAPLVITWQALRHRKDAPSKAARAYAFAELTRLGVLWAKEDAAAGRRADLVVRRKSAAGWTAADLEA